MSVEVIATKTGLESALAQVAQRMFKVCSSKGANEPIVVGLCGGRSVVGLLSALERESIHQPRELMDRIQFFMVDERLVPLTDEQSNFGGLKRLLFDTLVEKGVVHESQLHPFVTKKEIADFGCDLYLKELEFFGGKFTIVVLGVGEDGHVAGLFPQSATLQEEGLRFLHFHDSPKPPSDRMTASAALIAGAELSVVLALGEGKREAWNTFKNDGVTVSDCPAKLATKAHSCLVVTDLA